MKTLLVLFIGLLSLAAAMSFNAKTDPFGAQSAMHKVTSMNPTVVYAASPSIVDGHQPAATNLITWHSTSLSPTPMDGVEVKLSSEDKGALCASPNESIKSHPKYQRWCNEQ